MLALTIEVFVKVGRMGVNLGSIAMIFVLLFCNMRPNVQDFSMRYSSPRASTFDLRGVRKRWKISPSPSG